jgi:hypothetical protein
VENTPYDYWQLTDMHAQGPPSAPVPPPSV